MRILVISSTTWDVSNSFGNTFSNLFDGMSDVEIYNICCRNGNNNNNVVKEAIQSDGFLGIFTGGLKACAGGIAAAITAGLLVSLIFKPKDKT